MDCHQNPTFGLHALEVAVLFESRLKSLLDYLALGEGLDSAKLALKSGGLESSGDLWTHTHMDWN